MKTYKQLVETIRDYRQYWGNPSRWKQKAVKFSKYDDDYYDTAPDKLENDGKLIGWRQKLVPKRPIVSQLSSILPKSDDVIHRGISHEEYQNILKHGKIQSRGSGNIGDAQEGLTYYTNDPDSAASYANSFAMAGKTPTFKKPAYVVSIRKPSKDRIRDVPGVGSHEVGVIGDIPASEIVGVHRGNVIEHSPLDRSIDTSEGRGAYDKTKYMSGQLGGSSTRESSRVHWEKIK